MVRHFAHVGLPYCYRCAYGCDECAQQYAAELERAIDQMLAEAQNIDTALLEEMGVGTIWVDDFGEIAEVLAQIPTTRGACVTRNQPGKR